MYCTYGALTLGDAPCAGGRRRGLRKWAKQASKGVDVGRGPCAGRLLQGGGKRAWGVARIQSTCAAALWAVSVVRRASSDHTGHCEPHVPTRHGLFLIVCALCVARGFRQTPPCAPRAVGAHSTIKRNRNRATDWYPVLKLPLPICSKHVARWACMRDTSRASSALSDAGRGEWNSRRPDLA